MPDNIIKTLGGEGCEFDGQVYPVLKKKQVIDVSGGDTFTKQLCGKMVSR